MGKRVALVVLCMFLIIPLGTVLASETINLEFWAGFTGPDKFGMQKIVDNFNAEHKDIKVEFWTSTYTNLFTKFSTAFAVGKPPDVVTMHVGDIPQFASRGMLLPLDEEMKRRGIKQNEYFPEAWDKTFYKGVQYGIPLDFHPLTVYCYIELFEKAGLDPRHEFTNKEDFLNSASKLVVKTGEGEVTQYALSLGSTHPHTFRYWLGLLYQAGGTLLTSDNKRAAFNTPAGIEAYQFLIDLIYKYKVAPEHQFDINKDFLTGKTAMMIEGPWWVLAAAEQVNYATVPFPQIFGRKGVWASSHLITAPGRGDEKRQNAALTLVKYISDNSFDWGRYGGQIPAKRTIVESAEYKALENYPRFKTFIDEWPYLVYEPILIQTAQLGSDNSMSPLITSMQSIMLREKSPEDALEEAAKAVDTILAK